MNSGITFTPDFDSSSVYVMKVYQQNVTTIWSHFTQSDLLALWWAPKPWKCETVKQEFSENGTWLYIMLGPNGEKHFAKAHYGEIKPNRSFDWTDAFCDENGVINEKLPKAKWLFGFTGVEEGTKVTINIHFDSEEEMRSVLDMGFEEGFKMGLLQLEEVLQK